MKKFLVFLVAIIVVVSLGLTTYYFLRNDEVISFNTKEVYLNVGDMLTLDDLGHEVLKKHDKTTYNFNAGDETVTSCIEYDESKGYYVAKAGGDVELKIITSNGKYAEFKINVHIGNGSEANPYYISNQGDLSLIGDTYELDANFDLRNDITLTSDFTPIGKNIETGVMTGFSGKFNGNGYSISGLNLINGEYENAGLFSTINADAVVTDLTLKNITINGSYSNAGALAGIVAGEVSRVKVQDADITNLKEAGITGALIGTLTGKMTVSSADNATISVGDESNTTITAIAGGLVGKVDNAKVQAVYANSTINLYNATGIVGGLVGELVIGTNAGSIEESYSISTSNYVDAGAFIGTISKNEMFNEEVANRWYYLNGNYVVAGTNSVVKTDNSGLYTTYYNKSNAIYFIVDFNSVEDMMANTEYVFYAMAQDDKVVWNTLAWDIKPGALPVLNMTASNLSTISRDYLMRDISNETIGDITADTQTNAQIFLNYIEECRTTDGAIKDKKYVLATDIDLTGYDYRAIDLTNSTFDGNGKTITVNVTHNFDHNIGLFARVSNSTVKNLTIKVLGLAGSNNVGALAGVISSTSDIRNITTIYPETELNFVAHNFGGLAGLINDGVTVDNVSVTGLTINLDADIDNVGGISAEITNSVIMNSEVSDSTLYATYSVAGAVAFNSISTIDNINVTDVTVAYAGNGGTIGGIVATNDGNVKNSKFTGNISIEAANDVVYVGGVAGKNSGSIDNVVVLGNGIDINNTIADTFYIGGVVGNNNGTIADTQVNFTTIGSYIKGKSHYVGGIAATNSGANSNIIRSVVTSDINGNYVGGIVAVMNNGGAKIDQVFVGKNLNTQNLITGDKMVAGIAYNFASGEITNVQAISEIKGQETDTRSSLIVLEFPANATLKNATINSSLNGNGIFYLDTYNDKTNEGNGAHYNVYEAKGCAGVIESVTINNTAANKYGKDIKRSQFVTGGALFFWQQTTYKASGNTSYYKVVNEEEFNITSTFTTACELSKSGTGVFMLGSDDFSYDMQYDFLNNIWSDNNGTGISLAFLNNIFTEA